MSGVASVELQSPAEATSGLARFYFEQFNKNLLILFGGIHEEIIKNKSSCYFVHFDLK